MDYSIFLFNFLKIGMLTFSLYGLCKITNSLGIIHFYLIGHGLPPILVNLITPVLLQGTAVFD